MALPTKLPEVPTAHNNDGFAVPTKLLGTDPLPLKLSDAAAVAGVVPPSFGGHQSALLCWHLKVEVALEDTATLASLSAEDGPELQQAHR